MMDTTEQLTRLKELLRVPTFFRKEHPLLRYLIKYLRSKSYYFEMDEYGNIYVTKGEAEFYPLVCAHTDSVQPHTDIEIHEITYKNKLRLIGKHSVSGEQCGIGADDKAGVFICLELLEAMSPIKVVLFTGEEFGCHGSYHAREDFFKDVGYAIEFDCYGSSDVTKYCNGIQLFDPDSEFFSFISPILENLMPETPKFHKHPYTDVWQLKRRFDFSCINIAAGYHRYHQDNEYVVVEETLNAVEIGKEIIEMLGANKYEYKPKLNEKASFEETAAYMRRFYPSVFENEEQTNYLSLLTE